MVLSHLILVACHAVYRASNFNDVESDAAWSLQDFQKGEPPFYLAHIRRGIELAAGNPAGLLVFSGGQTRVDTGPRSEAQSYWWLADHFSWWTESVRARATTEEFARDSFENLLFGICRFREYAGRYPERVTLVSWQFKQRRFDMHRKAIRFPDSHFTFWGENDPPEIERVRLGEERNAVQPFSEDPYGRGPFLAGKRVSRNPFRRHHGYLASCPELAGLLTYAGPALYQEPLPWDCRPQNGAQ